MMRALIILSLLLVASVAFGQTVPNMPNVSIPMAGTEQLYIVQNATDRNVTVQQLGAALLPFALPTAVQGDILYYNGTAWAVLPPGASGQALETQGNGANPIWATVSGTGTVTSVGLSTPNSSMTIGGTNPVTISGTIQVDINTAHANTWSGIQSFNSGKLLLNGATSGTMELDAAAIAGTNRITFPAGSTDFTSTGGSNQVVKQAGSGAAFTVGTLACANLSDGGTACAKNTGTSGATVPLLNAANVWSAQQSGSITTLSDAAGVYTPDGSNNHYTMTLVHADCPCTLANPSATPVAGTTGVIRIVQSATGSDTIGTWGSQYLAPGGTASITLSAGANAIDVLAYYVQDSTHIYLIPSTNFSH